MKKLFLTVIFILILSNISFAEVDLTQCQVLGNNNPNCVGKVEEKIQPLQQVQPKQDRLDIFVAKFINMVMNTVEEQEVKVTTFFEQDEVLGTSKLIDDTDEYNFKNTEDTVDISKDGKSKIVRTSKPLPKGITSYYVDSQGQTWIGGGYNREEYYSESEE